MQNTIVAKYVSGIKEISGSENIEIIQLDTGEELIVRKNKFKVGDLFARIELDNFRPYGIDAIIKIAEKVK